MRLLTVACAILLFWACEKDNLADPISPDAMDIDTYIRNLSYTCVSFCVCGPDFNKSPD